jgi:hypothetical protein
VFGVAVCECAWQRVSHRHMPIKNQNKESAHTYTATPRQPKSSKHTAAVLSAVLNSWLTFALTASAQSAPRNARVQAQRPVCRSQVPWPEHPRGHGTGQAPGNHAVAGQSLGTVPAGCCCC